MSRLVLGIVLKAVQRLAKPALQRKLSIRNALHWFFEQRRPQL
jgi:hypothetical protein